MTREEHLLAILAEESVEVAQRCTKALRFGLHEIQTGQTLTNAQRLMGEYADLLAILEMLQEEGHLHRSTNLTELKVAKKLKIEGYLSYSRELGTLVGE